MNYTINVKIDHHNFLPISVSNDTLFNALYLNAQSLRNSLHDLQDFVDTSQIIFHVILVTETWLRRTEISLFNLRNYTAFHAVRPDKHGGGVAIFILNSFDKGNIFLEQNFINNNILGIHLQRLNVKIILCYRQPNNSLDRD